MKDPVALASLLQNISNPIRSFTASLINHVRDLFRMTDKFL